MAVADRNHQLHKRTTLGFLLASCSHPSSSPSVHLHQRLFLLLSHLTPLPAAASRQRHTWISCHAPFPSLMPLWSHPPDNHTSWCSALEWLGLGNAVSEQVPPVVDADPLQQSHSTDRWRHNRHWDSRMLLLPRLAAPSLLRQDCLAHGCHHTWQVQPFHPPHRDHKLTGGPDRVFSTCQASCQSPHAPARHRWGLARRTSPGEPSGAAARSLGGTWKHRGREGPGSLWGGGPHSCLQQQQQQQQYAEGDAAGKTIVKLN